MGKKNFAVFPRIFLATSALSSALVLPTSLPDNSSQEKHYHWGKAMSSRGRRRANRPWKPLDSYAGKTGGTGEILRSRGCMSYSTIWPQHRSQRVCSNPANELAKSAVLVNEATTAVFNDRQNDLRS